MSTFLNVRNIIERAKIALNFKRDSELASYLGVSRGTVSNWCVRGSIDLPLLLEKLKGVDYNWLILGEPLRQNAVHPDKRLIKDEVQMLHNQKTPEITNNRTVILYDLPGAGDLKTLFADKDRYAIGKIHIPSIPLCDGALYINGDSMYPILKSGDMIGFKELRNPTSVIYGEIYLVSFSIGGEEYLTLKYANRSKSEGYLKLMGYNPQHEPIEIPFTAIDAIALVKFSIRKHMMV